MSYKKQALFTAFILISLILLLLPSYCNLPEDPVNPSNSKVEMILKSSYGKQSGSFIEDSVGKAIGIGTVCYLPEFIDSIRLVVNAPGGVNLLDIFLHPDTTRLQDTLWTEFTLNSPGSMNLSITPYAAYEINSAEANILVYGLQIPANNKPSLTITGNPMAQPGQVCTLSVLGVDADPGQTLSFRLAENPDGSYLSGDSLFVWNVPATFTGNTTILFIATDNGAPPLSDTAAVIITASGDTGNSAPQWHIDTLTMNCDIGLPCSQTLQELCEDLDGDTLTFLLVAAGPAGDTISGGEYLFTATNAAVGTNLVKIVVSDPYGANDTLVIKLIVEASASDVTAPSITIVTPPENAVVTASSVPVDVICTDASGIASVTVAAGGNPVTMDKQNGHYTATVTGLIPGNNTITVTATDASPANNTGSKLISVDYSAPCTITYDRNEGTSGTVPVDGNAYSAGLNVTVMGNTGNLIRTGFVFSGWNTKADGSGTAYTAGSTFKMPVGGMTLFAQWTIADNTAPAITKLSGPVSGTTVTDATATYSYKITDETGIAGVYWTLNGTRMTDLTPGGAGSNEYTITATLRSPPHENIIMVYAADKSPQSNTDSTLVTLNYNQPPTATPQTNLTTPRATALSITLAGTDPENDPLSTWTINGGPYHGTIGNSRPTFTYTPTGNFEGKDSLVFTVSDGISASAPEKIVITVTASNIAPVITTQPVARTINKNQQATFTVAYNGDAYPVPDYIRWVHNNTDTVTDANGLTLTITADEYADSGNYKAVVRSSAFTTPAVSNNVKLTVKDVTAPVVTLTGSATVEVNQNASWTDPGATATDDKDGALTPDKTGTFDLTTPGVYTLTYTATDKAGNNASKQRTVTVVAVCPGYTFSCGTCGHWDFESNTVEGWIKDVNPNWPLEGGGLKNSVQSVTVSSAKAHTGSHALAAPINTYTAEGYLASVAVPFCLSGTTFNLAGYTLSAWVYFAGDSFDPLANTRIVAWGPDDDANSPTLWGSNMTPNTWIHMEISLANAVQASHMAVQINIEGPWTGTLYVDDVLITGP